MSVDFKCHGATFVSVVEKHQPNIEKCFRELIRDDTITVVVVSVAGGAGVSDAAGKFQASVDVNLGVMLTRDAAQAGTKTLVEAAAALQDAAKDGSMTRAMTGYGVPISAVSANSNAQVIASEDDVSGSAQGTASAAGASLKITSVWAIALMAVGGVLIVSLIVVASVLIVRRRRRAAAAAAAAAAAPAVPAAPANMA